MRAGFLRTAAIASSAGVFGALLSGSVSSATAPPLSGIFVNVGADARGALLTLQAGQQITSVRLTPNVAVAEGPVRGPLQNSALTALKPGEPLTLWAGSDGRITRIEGRYLELSARLALVAHGYLITTSGAAYKLSGTAGQSVANLPLGTYLLLRSDPQGGSIFDLLASRSPLAAGENSRKVAVTFVVRVPANTPAADAVYLATNTQNWTPNSVRMTPTSGNRWSATLPLGAGTLFEYKYTRGSWSTDERNAAGAEISNRSLSVTTSGDAQTRNDSVSRWADLPS